MKIEDIADLPDSHRQLYVMAFGAALLAITVRGRMVKASNFGVLREELVGEARAIARAIVEEAASLEAKK